MIEKIMKAVKSGNKKRGRNITVGAVVGMLLSCTAVMGAAEGNYLWIKNDEKTNGTIKFSTVDNKAGGGKWDEANPYEENNWDGNVYINNIILSGTDNLADFASTTNGYGLRLNGDLSRVDFINNGSISGIGTSWFPGIGIYIYSNNSSSFDFDPSVPSKTNSIGNLINNGNVYGSSTGIYIYSNSSTSNIENLTNNGSIYSEKNYSKGIHNLSRYSNTAKIKNLINNGNISSGKNYGEGIYNVGSDSGTAKIENLINRGSIYGSESGIYNFQDKGTASIGSIINSGVIYGGTNAIKNEGGGATIGQSYNYGILVAGSSNVVSTNLSIDSTTESGHIKNLGLTIKSTGTTATIDQKASDSTNVDVIVGYNDAGEALIRKMNIKNKNDSSSFSGTEGDNSILNALENTYKVDGDYTVTDSIINAYKTAVVFDTSGGSLTLSGTIVNGGLDGTSYVIAGGTGNDTLTLTNGTLINGTIDGGGTADSDTLNFGEAVAVNAIAASNSDDEIRVLHNISNFENININSNVTFYEKTIGSDRTEKDLKVKDVDSLIIGANGVLTLRINPTNTDGGDKIIGHALYGNDGVITSTGGGKLLLALNGAGNESIISFGDTTLDKSLVTAHETKIEGEINFATTSKLHMVKRVEETFNEVIITAKADLPTDITYEKLNEIYHSILSVDELGNFNVDDDEKLSTFLSYLNDIYAGNPYSYSSELSRKSAGMFRDIVTENIFRPETNKWMIYGGLTHVDRGTKDTYYGKGYYTYDIGSSDMDADTKITGAYMLGEYGVSDTLTSGVVIGGNKLKSDLSNGSKVDGSAMYLGAYVKKYVGNLKVTAGAGFQYGDYDADRMAINKVASDSAESVMKYSDNYNDITYDIYLNGRYSHNIGKDLFLEPYATLSYTYIDQDGANEGNKTLAIETDSKSFDYTVGKVGVDLKKVIPHEKGKSTLSAGVSYTKILDGADEEHITGRFKGGSNFDILVAHKNEHSIGLNAKYALELENGVIFDVKGTYSVERDSHNNSGKNRTKGEWIVGAGLGYKF